MTQREILQLIRHRYPAARIEALDRQVEGIRWLLAQFPTTHGDLTQELLVYYHPTRIILLLESHRRVWLEGDSLLEQLDKVDQLRSKLT